MVILVISYIYLYLQAYLSTPKGGMNVKRFNEYVVVLRVFVILAYRKEESLE